MTRNVRFEQTNTQSLQKAVRTMCEGGCSYVHPVNYLTRGDKERNRLDVVQEPFDVVAMTFIKRNKRH